MAFVPVPKDLNRVKTKVMFNLTKRQLICFSIAAAVGVPIFFLAKAHLDLSTAAMLMVVIMLIFLATGVSSCTAMFSSAGSSVIASSYLSEDDAMLGAEAQYCRMEQELQRYLDTYESTHNYDEYHFDLDDIEHDPYVLISILSALHEGEFTLDEVQGTLQMLFEKQYILTEAVIVETRYRAETDTWTDADGNTHTETYRVPYDYYICNVKLENFNLSHVPVYIMSQEQLSMYATYMSVLGNREDLFGDSP